MSTAADILRGARGLLSDESRWTQGTMARASDGYRCSPQSPGAACWCMIGAVIRSTPPGFEFDTAVQYLRRTMPRKLFWRLHISRFNDDLHRTHAEVMAAFDRAIALAEAA